MEECYDLWFDQVCVLQKQKSMIFFLIIFSISDVELHACIVRLLSVIYIFQWD